MKHESIHSSTAILVADSMQTIERENRQMATKKAPAKKAVKKAAKKAAKKK
jgi:cell division protein ZapA (FtsZ GTPase activity inhibitor)